MTVKELLLTCDISNVAALHFEIQEEPRETDWEIFLGKHILFLQDIKEIEPAPDDYLVLGTRFQAQGRTEYELHLYKKADILANFVRHEIFEGDWTLDQLSEEELLQVEQFHRNYSYPEFFDDIAAAHS